VESPFGGFLIFNLLRKYLNANALDRVNHMPRSRKVVITKKGKTLYARFYDSQGYKRFKSLKTNDEELAGIYQRQLENLSVDPTSPCDAFVHKLFYDEEKVFDIPDVNDDDLAYLAIKYQQEVKELKEEIKNLRQIEVKYNAIMQEAWARRIEKLQNMPSDSEILAKYYKHIKTLFREGKTYKTLLDDLKKFTKKDLKEMEVNDIYDFLEDDCDDKQDPNARWNKQRTNIFHFYRWFSVNFGAENIIHQVETRAPKPKEDPYWHKLEEVEAAVKEAPGYWKVIIQVKAYSGLCSHELRGMKVSDFYQDGPNWFFRVQVYEHRRTKNKKRIRNIMVHPEKLLPVMLEYMKTKKNSEFLFPSTVSGSEGWTSDSFSRHLNLNTPDNMNALSLRRTFGSLLLRSGKTEVEVAAAMGNSPAMVRKYYAKLLGKEVNIDF
jgi:integrase